MLLDDELKSAISPEDSIAFMFGCGDVRQLLMTLLFVAGKARDKVYKDVHITITDYNPVVVARNLVILDLVTGYGIAAYLKLPDYKFEGTHMAYIFSGYVLPAATHDHLQKRIAWLIDALESGKDLMTGWLFIPAATRRAVARVLRQWQNPLQAAHHQPGVMRRALMERNNWFIRGVTARNGQPPQFRQGLQQDFETYNELGILLPDRAFAERYDTPLVALMDAYKAGAAGAAERLVQHIDKNWATNVTLLSLDLDAVEKVFESNPWSWQSPLEQKVPHIEVHPCENAQRLLDVVPDNRTNDMGGVLSTVGNFMRRVSEKMVNFARPLPGSRVMIEVLDGEMTDVMERIRWDCLEARSKPAGSIDPSTFPRTYDRVHMSNVPEHIGGILTAAMYGRPLLRGGRPSHFVFTPLLYAHGFSSRQHFYAEHALMYDEKRIADHLAVVRSTAVLTEDATDRLMTPAARELYLQEHGDSFKFMMEGYQVWGRAPDGEIPRQQMLTRPAVQKWLYAHFLKICLPAPRDWSDSVNASEAPLALNLTTFIRLVCLLHERGYPAHWLSEVLFALSDCNITTTARAPTRPFTTPEDLDAPHASRRMTVAPWRTEFTTLLSIWLPLMPFGFIAPPNALVPPTEIAEFSITFSPFAPLQLRAPHFVLLFNELIKMEVPDTEVPEGGQDGDRLVVKVTSQSLYETLLDDERGDPSAIATRMRRRSTQVFTAMKYVAATRTASFWCRTDVMRVMKEGDWVVVIARVDKWGTVASSSSLLVRDAVRFRRFWSE